ncbi:MAG: trypsin-like peptidase domain-containing protein [Planctomycetota bacterium]
MNKTFWSWMMVLCLICPVALGNQTNKVSTAGLKQLDFREVIAKAKDKVFPAVVFIKCIRETHKHGKKDSEAVSGSGVLISSKGELLTNWHVVDKALEIRCLLYDGRAFRADVLGTDKDTDLALLQVKLEADKQPLPHAAIGDSDNLKEGDFVMAMGAPWGLNRSVSIGIVSCAKRFLPENSEYSLWIQTDAAISPGNSGGPLINTTGKIIGINTRGVLFGGDMGFAIPSKSVKEIIEHIRKHGKVNWSWTGLQLQPLKDFSRDIYFDATEGVIVAGTDPESPARRAGFEPRDRIIKINGRPLNAVTEEQLPAVRRTIGMLPKYKPAKVELIRNDNKTIIELVPREKGDVEGEELDCPRWDFTLKTINQFDNPDLYFHRKKGVFVYGIKHPGNAAMAGLRTKDIILTIDSKKITTLEEAKKNHQASLENIDIKHRIVISVLRNGLMRQIVLDFLRDYEKE